MDKGSRINKPNLHSSDNTSTQHESKKKKKEGKTNDFKNVVPCDINDFEPFDFVFSSKELNNLTLKSRDVTQSDKNNLSTTEVNNNKEVFINKEELLNTLKVALSQYPIFNNTDEAVKKLLKDVAEKSVEEALLSPAFLEAKKVVNRELDKGAIQLKTSFYDWVGKVLEPYKKNLDQLPDPVQEVVAAGLVLLEEQIDELLNKGVDFFKETFSSLTDSLHESLVEITNDIKSELGEWFKDLEEPLSAFTENLPEPLQAEIEKGLEYLKENFLDNEIDSTETLTELSDKLSDWKSDLEFTHQTVENDLISAQNDFVFLSEELQELTPHFDDATNIHAELSKDLQEAVAKLEQLKLDQIESPGDVDQFLEEQAEIQSQINTLKESIEQNELLLDDYTNDMEEVISDINEVEADILECQTQIKEVDTVYKLTDDLITETEEKIKESAELGTQVNETISDNVDKAEGLKDSVVVPDTVEDIDIPDLIGDSFVEAVTNLPSIVTGVAANVLSNSWLIYKTRKKYIKVQKRNNIFSGSDKIYNKWKDKTFDYVGSHLDFEDFKDYFFLCNFNDLDESQEDSFLESGLEDFQQQKNIIIQDKCIVDSNECAKFIKEFQGLLKTCMGEPGSILGEREKELAKDYNKLTTWFKELKSRSDEYKKVDGDISPDKRGRVNAFESLKMMDKLQGITKKYGVVIKYDTVGKRLKGSRKAAVHRISIDQQKFFNLLKDSNLLPDSNAIKSYVLSQSEALENLKEFKGYESYKLKHAKSNKLRAQISFVIGLAPVVPLDKILRGTSEHKIYKRKKKSIDRLQYRLDQVTCKTKRYNKKLIALIEGRLESARIVKTKHLNIKRKEAKRNRNVDVSSAVVQTVLTPIPFAGTGVSITGAVARLGVGYVATRARKRFDKKARRRDEFETPESVYKRLKVEYNSNRSLQTEITQMCIDLFGLSENQVKILMKMPHGHDLVCEKKMVKLSFCRPLKNKKIDKAIVNKKVKI